MEKRVINILKIILSLSILILLIKAVNVNQLYNISQKISPTIIIIVLIANPILWIFATINLYSLLKPLKFKIQWMKLYYIRIITSSIGLILPGRIGEFSLVYFLKKEQVETGTGTAIFVLDNLITYSVFIIFASLGIIQFFQTKIILEIIGVLIFMGLIIYLTIFTERGRKVVTQVILKKYAYFFLGFSQQTKELLKKHKKYILLNFFSTLIKLLISTYIYYLLIVLFGGNISFYNTLIINSAVTIISSIPITFGGVGIRESTAIFLYSLLGVENAIILAIQLLYLINNYIVAFIVFLIYRNPKKQEK